MVKMAEVEKVRVLVLGDMFVYGLQQYAECRHVAKNFDVKGVEVVWSTVPDCNVQGIVQVCADMATMNSPHVVVLHYGAFHLGNVSAPTLLADLECLVQAVVKILPNAKVIFSGLLPRAIWDNSSVFCPQQNNARCVINRGMCAFMLRAGMFFCNNETIDSSNAVYFKEDGISLSFMGNAMLFWNVRVALDKVM